MLERHHAVVAPRPRHHVYDLSASSTRHGTASWRQGRAPPLFASVGDREQDAVAE